MGTSAVGTTVLGVWSPPSRSVFGARGVGVCTGYVERPRCFDVERGAPQALVAEQVQYLSFLSGALRRLFSEDSPPALVPSWTGQLKLLQSCLQTNRGADGVMMAYLLCSGQLQLLTQR